jgi:hypothetical protein
MFRQLSWLLGAVLFAALLDPAAGNPGQGSGRRETGHVVWVGTTPDQNRFLFDCPNGHWDYRPKTGRWNIKLANGKTATDLGQLQPKTKVRVHFQKGDGETQFQGKNYRVAHASLVEVLPK